MLHAASYSLIEILPQLQKAKASMSASTDTTLPVSRQEVYTSLGTVKVDVMLSCIGEAWEEKETGHNPQPLVQAAEDSGSGFGPDAGQRVEGSRNQNFLPAGTSNPSPDSLEGDSSQQQIKIAQDNFENPKAAISLEAPLGILAKAEGNEGNKRPDPSRNPTALD